MQFDVETTGVQWYAAEAFLAQFGDDVISENDVLFDPRVDAYDVQELLSHDEGYYAWNSKFDLHFLDRAGYELPAEHLWHDGMVMAHVINENRSLALKAVGAKMFGESARDFEKQVKEWLAQERKRRREDSKADGTEYRPPDYSHVPDEIMHPYAMEDIVLTRAVVERYEKILRDNPELGSVYRFEMEVMASLFHMEKRGIPFDVANTHRFESELADNLERIEAECIDLAGVSHFNCNSPKQIVEALKRRGADLSFALKVKTGISTNEESLNAIDDPLADAILRFRGEYRNLNTYVSPLLHEHFDKKLHAIKAPYLCEDGRIRCNYHQVGAKTGRMSASDPPVQQYPRDDLRLRYLVKADEGKKLVVCDLDNIELHLFAAFAGDGPMLEAVRGGMDAHAQTAAFIGLQERKRATGVESKRDRGKRFNYSVLYGAGIRSIRRTFGVSQQEARSMLDRFHMAYPEVNRLQRTIEFRIQDRGYIKTYKGRRMRLSLRDAYKGPNFLCQGTAAEMLKEACVKLHKAGVPLIHPNHDELLAHVDAKDAEEVAHLVQEAMTDFPHITEKVPVTAEAKIVDRWSQAKKPDWKPSYAE